MLVYLGRDCPIDFTSEPPGFRFENFAGGNRYPVGTVLHRGSFPTQSSPDSRIEKPLVSMPLVKAIDT
jgi:hypothetical protein